MRVRVDLLDPGEQARCLSRIEPSLLSKPAIEALNIAHRPSLLSSSRRIEAAEPPVIMPRSIRHHEPAAGRLIQAGASQPISMGKEAEPRPDASMSRNSISKPRKVSRMRSPY
jgi:hypothetical protein